MSLPVVAVALMVVLAAVLIRVVNWVWITPKKLERYLRRQGLHGTPYTPLVGDIKRNVKMLMEARSKPITLTDDISPYLLPLALKMFNSHGRTFFMWTGPIPTIMITNPEHIKEVFSKTYDFEATVSSPLCLNQVFTVIPLATCCLLAGQNMVPAFYHCSSEVVSQWERQESSCEVDVWPWLMNLTADVISHAAFGSSYREGQRIFELQGELSGIIAQEHKKPYIPGMRFYPTKNNKRMKAIDKEIDTILRGMVSKREDGEAEHNDLLGILLESSSEESGGNGLSVEEILRECKLFYFAGQETTSVLLVWTMVLLSHHQDWQERAREEVRLILDDKNNKPDIESLSHLKVMSMIFYEVLRLYPPVSQLRREVNKEVKLGNVTLPAGVKVYIPTALIHRDPELWGEDAREFKPERFREGISKATKNQIVESNRLQYPAIRSSLTFIPGRGIVEETHSCQDPENAIRLSISHWFLRMKMEASAASVTVSVAIAAVLWWIWRTLNWVWFKPKMLEKYLRKQGMVGTPYTLLVGDVKREYSMSMEARSKPIKLTDDIVPRVLPFPSHTLKAYGRTFFTWRGPIPTITITDPEQIKEVLNKIYDYQKPNTFPLSRLVASGLFSYDGDKWAKHRRIINPAFHLEKIKNMVPAFHQSCSEVVGKWDNIVLDKGSSCEVDVWPWLMSMTADVISRTAFGSSYKEGHRIFELQAELSELIVQAFRKAFIPGYSYLPTKGNRRMKSAARESQAILRGIVNKRLRAILLSISRVFISRSSPGHRCTRPLPHFVSVSPALAAASRWAKRPLGRHEAAGTLNLCISLPILLVQRDTELWGQDAGEFKPERFKDGLSKATKNQVSYFPFSWGPRICIGQSFALLEAKMAMALILQRFSFELSPSYVHAPYTVMTIHPQFGAHLTLHKL
ncbi:hypothetical protein DY000_02043049 [Brassica cretica]|uniref:Cytochrome P450 n=1 Tax=Brassica cretica TaxID=69181 RepID=A0ABQ7B6M9_BRACR|nr:hypothetical protein DY000_02043049 [Brassica cretica]